MRSSKSQSGFTAVELLITLFVAAAFLMSGYQLYGMIIRDGGEVRTRSTASNVAYNYLQQQKTSNNPTNPCTLSTPINNQPETVDGLSNVTITVTISCLTGNPAPTISKILVTVKYNDNGSQQEVTNATYVTK